MRERPESGENDGGFRNSKDPVTREAVRSLIEELLDEKDYHTNHVRAMQSEPTAVLDLAQMILRGDMTVLAGLLWGPVARAPMWERAMMYPFYPVIELDTITAMRFLLRHVDAAREPNWPAARKVLPEDREWTPVEKLTHPITANFTSSLSRAIFLHYRGAAKARMAAVALAIRLYEIDHGRRPERLDQLVPDYLPAVPVDPLASDGRPIGYKPNAAYPILYSVGDNGEDDDGAYTFYRGGVDRRELDLPFFLAGVPPTEEPTSEE